MRCSRRVAAAWSAGLVRHSKKLTAQGRSAPRVFARTSRASKRCTLPPKFTLHWRKVEALVEVGDDEDGPGLGSTSPSMVTSRIHWFSGPRFGARRACLANFWRSSGLSCQMSHSLRRCDLWSWRYNFVRRLNWRDRAAARPSSGTQRNFQRLRWLGLCLVCRHLAQVKRNRKALPPTLPLAHTRMLCPRAFTRSR